MSRESFYTPAEIIVILVLVYFGISAMAWMWRNPELNEMQAYRYLWDVLLWR